MKNYTRVLFNAYLDQLAKLNGVQSAKETFSATPSVQQTLETKLQQSVQFLQRINVIGVDQPQGEKIGLGVSGTIASTTNTATTDRAPADFSTLDTNGYNCLQINYDTALKYSKLDIWAKFPDFQTRIRNAILVRQALDRITIGFNGTSRAATSNRGTNPLLQDVGKGWLQKYRDNAAASVMTHGAVAGSIRVGTAAGNDYKNLDALVYDAVGSLIGAPYQDDTGLVNLVGRGLLDEKYFPIINDNQTPSESLAGQMIVSQKLLGGLPAIRVPYFPTGKIMITTLANLSVYFQNGTRRRTIVDNAKRDQIENYESSNDDWVVEDYEAGCVLENIVFTW